jgi:hypothetical protein
MTGRRISARRLSMSPAAKQLLKDQKRRKKLGLPEKQPDESKPGIWAWMVVALVVIVFFVFQVLS